MRRTSSVLLCAMLTACDSSTPPPSAPAPATAPFRTTLSVKQLMNWIIDPNADVLWDSVGTIITEQGREELLPRTDEEWATVRNSAAMLVESGNLLMLDARAFDREQWMQVARGLSLILMLPTLENKSSFVKNLFGDWEVAAIGAYSSGQALTVYTTSIPGLNGGPSGASYDNNQRPNVTGQSCQSDGGLPEQILNAGAFTLNGYQIGSIGNAGRGICRGPDYMQIDLSLYKNIRLSDRVRAQLRFEVFNVFNRNTFLSSQMNVTFNPSAVTFDTGPASTANTITSFTGIPGNFGQSSGTRDARQAQFGIKLLF